MRVGDLELPPRSLLPLIVHPDGSPVVPDSDTMIEVGAVVLAVTVPEHEAALRRILSGVD
jgi:Trk K+ transport system NAD-binding subunit